MKKCPGNLLSRTDEDLEEDREAAKEEIMRQRSENEVVIIKHNLAVI